MIHPTAKVSQWTTIGTCLLVQLLALYTNHDMRATMHSITDRQTDRQMDGQTTGLCQ